MELTSNDRKIIMSELWKAMGEYQVQQAKASINGLDRAAEMYVKRALEIAELLTKMELNEWEG